MKFDGELADELIRQSRNELDREESAIEALAEVAAFDYVALYAQAASQRAAYRHAGVFNSPAIDRALLAAGASLDSGSARSHGAVERVLHVATETPWPQGGHSRMIERWIRSDAGRSQSLVLTSPRRDLPPDLGSAIWNSQGSVHELARGSSSFMQRAAELRQVASEYDAVVLHTHPYDVVPTIAFATPNRPPCIAFNMAGHLFWIGTRVADVVASGRRVAIELGVGRRGVMSEASHLLPVIAESLALAESGTSSISRGELRRKLGIEPDDFVFVTVASAYKLDPVDPYNLAGIVMEVVSQRPSVRWLVVGAPPTGRLANLVADTARITCIAPTHDVKSLYAAGDAYLDSYPFTSQTSLLDAAASGLPVFALRGHPTEAAILSAWGGTLDDVLIGFSDAAALADRIDELIDARKRAPRDHEAPDAVASQTVGSNWASRLDAVFNHARERVAHRLPNGAVPVTEVAQAPTALDRYLALLSRGSEPSRVFLAWQRSITNHGATTWFPGDAEWLSRECGLPGVVGQLELSMRDQEQRFQQVNLERVTGIEPA